MLPKVLNSSLTSHTTNPARRFMITAFNIEVFPPRNLTAKYNGNEEIMNIKIVTSNAITSDVILTISMSSDSVNFK